MAVIRRAQWIPGSIERKLTETAMYPQDTGLEKAEHDIPCRIPEPLDPHTRDSDGSLAIFLTLEPSRAGHSLEIQ